MKFLPKAPVFAAEVRSQDDYGAAAERAMAVKRADYFASGTPSCGTWTCCDDVVRVYRATDSATPRYIAVASWRKPNLPSPTGGCPSPSSSSSLRSVLLA
jgi:hypothetical protein